MSDVCSWPRCSCKATGIYCDSKPGQKKAKGLRPVSEKGKLRKQEKKVQVLSDAEFYLQIWNERVHEDFETEQPIPGEFRLQYFHHVLAKRKKVNEHNDYSRYRHCKWNIVLVSWQTHDIVERNIDLAPKIKAYTERLIRMHENGELDLIPADRHFI